MRKQLDELCCRSKKFIIWPKTRQCFHQVHQQLRVGWKCLCVIVNLLVVNIYTVLKVWLVLWTLIRNSSCNGPLKAEYLVSLHEVWTWIYLVYLLFVMFDIVLLFALIPAAAAINMCSLLCYKLNEETGMSHWVNVSRTDLDSCSWGDFCSTAQRARDWKNMMLEIILSFPVKQQAVFLFFFCLCRNRWGVQGPLF